MTKALSVDLRDRVVAAVEGGLSRRRAAERFGVSVSSAIRWTAQARATGDVRPRRVGGDKRSRRVEACAPLILGAVEARPDITLVELQALLAARGGCGGLDALALLRPPKDHAKKKSAHAAEQEHADVLSRRED